MDGLSYLLQLAQVRVRLDVRCLLAGAFDMRHEALGAGEATFHFLVAGQCVIRMDDGRELRMQAGDFVLLPRGSAHVILSTSQPDEEEEMRPPERLTGPAALQRVSNVQQADLAQIDLLCGRFLHDGGAGYLFSHWLPPLLLVNLNTASTPGTLDALVSLLRFEGGDAVLPAANAVMDGVGQALLALALRAHAGQLPEGMQEGLLPLLTDARLAASIHAVLSQPQAQWTIESMGEKAAMSRATYARHFQARAGFGVSEFLLRVRMMQACALLERSTRSIGDIADAVGYASEASFGAAFSRLMGETPARWRRTSQLRAAA